MANLGGFHALGHFLAGGNAPQAALMEAQGESLGANTENAIAQAQERIRKNSALSNDLPGALAKLYPDHPEVAAALGTGAQAGVPLEQITGSRLQDQQFNNRDTVRDLAQPYSGRVAAAQAVDPSSLGNALNPNNAAHIDAETAESNARTNTLIPAQAEAARALAGLNVTKDKAGGFAPSPYAAIAGGLSPELQKAVSEGRLDPRNLNVRNIAINDQIAKNDPTYDFNAAHSGAVLQSNAAFRQKAGTVETLPGNIAHLTDLGTKLDYSPVRFAGAAQAWLKGELNDPALTEYMTVRNDTLLKLAATMRGVGMSDQAHTAEIEASKPTMSPAAMEAWARGQMSVIETQMAKNNQLMHPNVHTGTAPGAPLPAAAPVAVKTAAMGGPPGWTLHQDAHGNRAYVSPDGKQFQEVK